MSVIHRLYPRERWWRLRKHAVCVHCHKYGRLWCEAHFRLWNWRLLDLWWWLTDAVVADTNKETHAITHRTRRIVPWPKDWTEDEELYQRLYDFANVLNEEWERRISQKEQA